MKIDFPTTDQIPGLRRLWKQAFADEDEFLDSFFATGFAPNRCLCVSMENTVAAALYWMDMTCRGANIAYIYAVATDKDHQNQGLCRNLMEKAHAILETRNYAGSILVPEDDALAAMYERHGYRFCTSISQFVSTVGPYAAAGHRIDKEEFLRRREALLPDGGVQLGRAALDFLDSQVFFFAGADFLATGMKGTQGFRCLELLGNTAAAPEILNALGLTHGSFRAPGDGRPFAMYRPIDPNIAAPTYLGFAFD